MSKRRFVQASGAFTTFSSHETATVPVALPADPFYADILAADVDATYSTEGTELPKVKRPKRVVVLVENPDVPVAETQRPTIIPDSIKTDFLRSCQNADLKSVAATIQAHPGIVHIRDTWHWSPLMVAAASGQGRVCSLLLEKGANLFDTDENGRDSLVLARQSRHEQLAREFEQLALKRVAELDSQQSRDQPPPQEQHTLQSSTEETRPDFYCTACEMQVSGTEARAHPCSTVHVMATATRVEPPVYYGIPSHNIGFKLLVKNGWTNRAMGLGKDESGRIKPISTVLKLNKHGIGIQSAAPRITHTFIPSETKPAPLTMRQRNVELFEDQQKTRSIRNALKDI